MMTRLFSLLLICASAWAIPAAGKYHGDQVLRVKYETNLQEAELQSLLETDNGISMWNDHWTGEVDFHVPAISLGVVKEKLATYDVSVMVENVQYIVDEEKRNSNFNKDLRGTTPTPDQMFSDYFDYQVINNFMNGLPGASSFVLNQTYNGNPITAFQFGTGPKNIVFQGGIHAREWISPAVVTYVSWWLASDNAVAADLRKRFTFTVVPVLNVDGYIYTRQFDGDRMWRKNRQPNPGSSCIGTDGNRNYQYKWGQAGSSSSPCAETYKGPFPYSTAEASSVTNFIIKTPNVVSYIDFHSYSQFIMLPTGPVCKTYVKDYTDLLAASTSAVAALKAVTGTVFQTRAFCGPSDAANGSSEDNAYNLGVKYSYTAELRDTGSYGFILPATQIRASGEEMIKAITALWLYADAH